MSRAVTPVSRRPVGPEQQVSTGGDSYQERLVKYFPIETSGPYLAASAAITGLTDAHTTARTVWLLLVFAILLLGTVPLLMRQYPAAKYANRWLPIGFGLAAFVIWAYSLGALPQELGVYNPVAAAVLPILYGFGANFNPTKAEDPR
ncbi:hypothetical protein ACWDSJ_24185 [Nocardia sp. NPDC003482]